MNNIKVGELHCDTDRHRIPSFSGFGSDNFEDTDFQYDRLVYYEYQLYLQLFCFIFDRRDYFKFKNGSWTYAKKNHLILRKFTFDRDVG